MLTFFEGVLDEFELLYTILLSLSIIALVLYITISNKKNKTILIDKKEVLRKKSEKSTNKAIFSFFYSFFLGEKWGRKRKENGPCSNEQGPEFLLYFLFFSEQRKGKRFLPLRGWIECA